MLIQFSSLLTIFLSLQLTIFAYSNEFRDNSSKVTYSRQALVQVFQETSSFIEQHPLPPQETSLHRGEETSEATQAEQCDTTILVVNASTFQMTQALVLQGYRPLVLDMANATKPGGATLAIIHDPSDLKGNFACFQECFSLRNQYDNNSTILRLRGS